MIGGDVEDGGHLPALGAVADEPGITAPAERQRKTVEQDRLARAGFAGEHRQTVVESEIKPLDQDDVADRKLYEHGFLQPGGSLRTPEAPDADSHR